MLEIKFDAQALIGKYERLPTALRSRLRVAVMQATNSLADRVRAKLVPGALGSSSRTGLPLFATTRRLLPAVAASMRESASTITGKVAIGPSFPQAAAASLEFGSKPHVIVPRNARFLVFMKDGHKIFARRVNHPGFPGAHFMAAALKEETPTITETIRAALLQEIKQ